jgi:septum formation protein
MSPRLVLASTSPWRAELLGRLGLPFLTVDPRLDETPWHNSGLPPEEMVLALASAKAQAAVSMSPPDGLILAADQVAEIDGQVLYKPKTRAGAVAQLALLSGRTHRLLTGLVLMEPRTGRQERYLDVEALSMRSLTTEQIHNYVDREDVLSCAGSYRIEGLGISLFESFSVPDFTGVVGLPLLAVVRMLAHFDISPLD